MEHLAELYSKQGRYHEAEPLYQQALAIQERSLRSNHPDLAETLKSYAVLLRKTKRKSEANAMDTRAKGIIAENPTTSVNRTIDVRVLGLRSNQEGAKGRE